MDLIVNTWTTAVQSPLAYYLILGSCTIGMIGLFAVSYTRFSTSLHGAIPITIGLATATIVAIGLYAGYTQPLDDERRDAASIEATGTIDTITPGLTRGGTGIRLTEYPDILLAVAGDNADTLVGLEGHPTTLHCTAPRTLDREDPALAAGTILDCAPLPRRPLHIRDPRQRAGNHHAHHHHRRSRQEPPMTETLLDCPKPGCGYSTEGRTPREAQARLTRHMSRTDHMIFTRRHRAALATSKGGSQ